jgi:predicted 3-demethylubiquinone-9 3-methyltransferase (glyoxalase superfamily)
MAMEKITPCLWFDKNAEEAVQFYTSIFKDSKILEVARYTDVGPGPKGSIMTIKFQLNGQEFLALNGGPEFKFTEAISLIVYCKDQQEVDEYWDKLSAGGKEIECGWVKDKFGLSWQVTPTILPELMKDSKKAPHVMKAMMKMVKLDVEALKQAGEKAA